MKHPRDANGRTIQPDDIDEPRQEERACPPVPLLTRAELDARDERIYQQGLRRERMTRYGG